MQKNKRLIIKLMLPIVTLVMLSCPALAAPVELSLADSIALALKNNRNIAIANSEKENAYWAVKQAEAGKGFTLNLTHTDERYNTPPSYLTNYKYVWTTKFDNELAASFPVYSGGKLESQIDQAKLNLKVSDLSLDATKQQLRQQVTSAYFNLLQYRNELQVNQETVDNYTAHLKNVQAQYQAGTVAKSDVLASKVSLADAQDNLIKAQNNCDLAVATLNNLIGLPLDSESTPKESLRYEKYSLTLAECNQYALAHRPEIAQYQAQIASAQDDIKIAESGYRPSVDLFATEDWYDKDLPGADNNNWSIGLTASFNVFDSGLTGSKLKQAQANLKKVQEQSSQESESILLEVRQYYLSLREAEKRIETNQVAVEQAQDNFRIAEVRYRAGVGTNLDVLDAVLSLSQAKINDIQALYDYNTSKAQLDTAMGIAVE
ncbi:outer membrane efflux protein [Lucifera butyrica]|uniref:Outer membrane efflux protein n=1 Tax=Lucifera butyrica TaxID=1351585 RepID=A0A498R1C2_9FIRM|nr:TolC family protein [Lucifera butyrica]VBB05009.1 outer membrane efflux protein [Lucifera butyrica]